MQDSSNKSNQFKRHTWQNLLCFMFLWVCQYAHSDVSVADLTVGANTTYTIAFEPVVNLNATDPFGGDVIVILTSAGGPDFSGASLQSLSGGTITGSITSQNATSFNLTLNGAGTVSAGNTVTIVVNNVINPGTAGQGPDYTARTAEFSVIPPIVDDVTLPGNVYTSSNLPVVTNPIADLTGGNALFEGDGAQQIIADLDTVFEDGDGDTLTFSVDAGNDINVATASISVGDALTVTPTGSGSTNITIRATSVDGTTTDTFAVTVIGELDNATATPQSLDAGATTTYDVSFNPASTIVSGQLINVITGTGGPDYTNAGMAIVGGSLTGTVFSQSTGGILIQTTGGTASSADLVQITLTNVDNPGAAGQGPDYQVRLTDFSLNVIDQATVAGSIYGAVSIPTVANPIANQNLNEVDGATVVVADLNTVFSEGDGDPLSFNVEPGNDTNIAAASVMGDELTVTPTGPGTTTITVRASDQDGSVTDSFDVNVIGIMDNASFVPLSSDTDANTSYNLAFTSSSVVAPIQAIIISNASTGGPDYSTATLDSISGGTLSGSISGQSSTSISIEITAGSANVGTAISLSLSGVVNPTIGGQGPDYDLSLFRVSPAPIGPVEVTTVSGTQYIDVGIPSVTAPIDDQLLFEVDGSSVIVSDLNTVFTDGNGQNLVFTVEPGNDSSIATAQINGDQLTVTPLASGITNITVQASDLAAGGTGTATDVFEVSVVGEIDAATIVPTTLEINAANPYSVTFTPALEMTASDVIVVSTEQGGPVFNLASLENFSGGNMTASLIAQNPRSVEIEILSGTTTDVDVVSFDLNPVVNPATEGTAPDYLIEVVAANKALLASSVVVGNTYVDTDTIFINGFETATLDPDVIAKSIVALIPYVDSMASTYPFYDSELQHYFFLSNSFPRDDDNQQMMDEVTVIRWLEEQLKLHLPYGDWDADGMINLSDPNPFNIQ